MSDRWLYAWALGSVSLGGASLVIPLYVIELGGSPFTLGILAGVAALIGVPGALLAGPFVDTSGRHREIVLVALLAISAMLLVIPFVERISVIIIANAVIWLAFAAMIPVLTLLVVVGAAESQWSGRIARLNAFQGIGWGVGLVIGAILSILGAQVLSDVLIQRTLLVIYAMITLVGVLVGARQIPRRPTTTVSQEPRRLRRAIMQANRFNIRSATFPFTPARVDVRGLHPQRFVDRFTRVLALYFLALLLCFAGFAAFFAPLPAFLDEAAFSDGEIFALYVISSVGAAVSFGLAGRLAEQRDPFTVQASGLFVRAGALPVVAVVVAFLGAGLLGLAAVGAVFFVIGISWALIIVTAGTLVSQLSPPTIRGESLGVYSALMALAGGIGSIIGGRLALYGYLIAFTVAAMLVFAGGALVILLRNERLTSSPP